MVKLILLVLACVCFAALVFEWNAGDLNLMPLGLTLFAASFLFGADGRFAYRRQP